MSYLEYLVRRYIFDIVQVMFLPMVHTHKDIDQAFSTTWRRLKVHDGITLAEMHE